MLSNPLKWLENLGGVKLPHHKDTVHLESMEMPVPATVEIKTLQHRGSGPCKPLVKSGDKVKVGQRIADSEARFSAPVHASVSGTVLKVTDSEITIEADGRQTVDESVQAPVIKSRQDFVAAVRNSGLVGLGGAGFPTHVKLDVEAGIIDRLVINAAECEPFITSDTREIYEKADDIVLGTLAVLSHLQAEKAIIGIEDGHASAIKHMKEAIARAAASNAKKIEVKVLPVIYPQGAEKGLVKAATGRVISSGQLPSSVGCVVMNVTSVAELHRYLTTGMPLVARRITVDGSAIKEPKNVIAPIGTAIQDIIAFAGGFKKEAAKLIMGGPMMGEAIPTLNANTSKFNNAILAFAEEDAFKDEATDCIRCSRCVSVCPMSLMPLLFEKNNESGNAANLKNLSVMDCVECGSCSYICPSNRPLVESIRAGKNLVKTNFN